MSLAAATSPTVRVSLLAVDHELAPLLSAERRREAEQRLRVDIRRFGRGRLDLDRLAAASPGNIGLLIVGGIVAREVVLGDTVSAELLGPGDLIRPWALGTGCELLECEVRWSVLSETADAALLDRRCALELGAFPEVGVALMDRFNERSTRLATAKAISQLTRVDRRLTALLWQLAERWGRVTADGVLVPLRLSHRLLAALVGARRPTVSTALSELTRRGAIARRDDGSWLLPHDGMAALRALEVERIEPRLPVVVPLGSDTARAWKAHERPLAASF